MEENQNMEEKLTPKQLLEKYRYKGKLNDKLHDAVVSHVVRGTPAKSALRMLGVADSTIRLWQGKAEEGEKKYRELFDDLDSAWAQWQDRVAGYLPKHVEKDSRVCIDVAGRIMRDDYGKTEQIAVDNPALVEFTRAIHEALKTPGEWTTYPEDVPLISARTGEE